jgi:hypothetical protein
MTRFFISLLLAAAVAACSFAPPARPDEAVDLIAARALAAAAPPDAPALTRWLSAERARISAERQVAGQRFDETEKTCWQRFVVNACLRDARDNRRATLERLRQEELALDGVERQRRAALRLRQLQDKQTGAAAVEAPE